MSTTLCHSPRSVIERAGVGPRRARHDRRSGFTLIELLVAIGAVALLAVGLAQIFSVTGQTVSAGRRLSNLTTYAGVLQRQLQADFERMSRDGFLLIRNELANNGAAVQAFPADASPRVRRVDEIMFFAHGEFRSGRAPVNPARTAESNSARIYYGHGLRRDPNNAASMDPVNLADDNRQAMGFGLVPPAGSVNPNRYASDWVLQRQVTLLAPPGNVRTTVMDYASNPPAPRAEVSNQRDSDYQVGLQPAAPSIFRSLAAQMPAPQASQVLRSPPVRPGFGCGAIDVAATDLSTVRATILNAGTLTNANLGNEYVAGATQVVQNIQALMRDALPSDSDRGLRTRVEIRPPNYLGEGWAQPPTDEQRADQLMLAASAFLPRCTEFIVEWSFGVTLDPTVATSMPLAASRPVWYGLNRTIDIDGNGTADDRVQPLGAAGAPMRVRPSFDSSQPLSRTNFIPSDGQPFYDVRNNLLVSAFARRLAPGESPATTPATGLRVILPAMLCPQTAISGVNPNNVQYSYFGFVDPTFVPSTNGAASLLVDVNGNGRYDPADGDRLRDPDTVPWPWPRMIRVTVSLADPQDPSVEQTFQFIFDAPGTPTGSAL